MAAEPDPLPASEGWPAPGHSQAQEPAGSAPAAGTPAAPETFGAGFTHCGPGSGGGQGFASGGLLDTMGPGPVLAQILAGTWARGLPALTDDELIGVLGAARRQSSWGAALELAVVADLDRRRTSAALASGDHRWAEHVPDEVGYALNLTGQAAGRLVDLATGVARLPAVTTALKAGRIDLARAGVFAAELAGLDHITAAAVAAVVIRDAETLTTTQLQGVLRRVVLGIDPTAARKRRERAQRDARVETWPELAGTAALAGRDLPPAEVLAADAQLTADASALKAAGADGSLSFLRARVYLARLRGQPLHTLLPAPPGEDGNRYERDARDHSDGRGETSGNPAATADAAAAGPAATGDEPPWPRGGLLLAGLKGSVNLTMPLATQLGWTDQPGEVAGYGPIDADTARDLADALARTPGNRWCLTLTDPGGHPVAHGCTAKSPGPPPSPPCPEPPDRGSPGPEPPAAGPPGPPPANNGPPGIPPSHNGPPDIPPSSNGPPGPPPESAPPANGPLTPTSRGDAAAWLSAISLRAIATGTCTHERENVGYRPSPSLRHLIQIRDITCPSPVCRRPATQGDQDHTIAYHRGGRTCECNLAPPCRHHHKTKQAPGWKLQQPQPGSFIWTTPSSRTYANRPGTYPA